MLLKLLEHEMTDAFMSIGTFLCVENMLLFSMVSKPCKQIVDGRSNVHFEMKNDGSGFKFILVFRRRDRRLLRGASTHCFKHPEGGGSFPQKRLQSQSPQSTTNSNCIFLADKGAGQIDTRALGRSMYWK